MNFTARRPLDVPEIVEITLDNGRKIGEITERYHRMNSVQRPMFVQDTTPSRLLEAERRGIRRFFTSLPTHRRKEAFYGSSIRPPPLWPQPWEFNTER